MSRVAVAMLGALLCAGCIGPGPRAKSEPPATYRLTAPAVDAIPDARGTQALGVSRPRAAPALDTAAIAIARPGQSFDYYSGVRWIEPAPAMLQQLLVQSLSATGRYATVVATPSRVPVDAVLDVELRRFEAVASDDATPPRVIVQLQFTVIDTRRGVRLGGGLVTAEAEASAARRGAVIAAFEEATATALRQGVDTVASTGS